MIAIGTSSSAARVTSRSSSANTGGCAVAQTTVGLTTEVTSGSEELLAVAKAAATDYGGADGRGCGDNAARATANPRFLSALHLHFVLSAVGPCLHTILRTLISAHPICRVNLSRAWFVLCREWEASPVGSSRQGSRGAAG